MMLSSGRISNKSLNFACKIFIILYNFASTYSGFDLLWSRIAFAIMPVSY
jgi:hypothetical protein